MAPETFTAPDPDHLGSLLPAYRFDAFIAQGGMGAVYKAVQTSLDRDVAIKVLPRELGANPEFRQSFETEAKAMARLNHPNLIGVYDFGDVEGMPYIVMEFVNGKSLYHSAWNKKIDPAQAVGIIRQICAGLGHAHDHGLIHRDIKPANILLTPKAEPKIGDFGLAMTTGGDGGGLAMGTPGYSSPETFTRPEIVDKRSDVYAVGVILHELITGQRPDPSGQQAMVPSGDPIIDSVWKTATHADPHARYPDANAMGRALERWQPGRGPAKLVTAAAVPAARPAQPPASTAVAGRKFPASPAVPAARPPGTVPVASSSGNKTIARNLIVSAVLIVAIAVAWELLQDSKASRKAANEQVQREQETARREAREKARGEAQARQPAVPTGDPGTTTPQPGEPSPKPTLTNLRQRLAAGERDPMPEGTRSHGQRAYLVVDEAMGWHQAAAFAADHGACLATVESEGDIDLLGSMVADGQSAWIGAGRSSRRDWVMIDGRDWPLDKTPTGAGDYATIDNLGLVRAGKLESRLPFILQWESDGSSPGGLTAILTRTRETLATPNPVYPPGTFAVGPRRFAVIPSSINRNDAARLAIAAGGMLATAASREEIEELIRHSKGYEARFGLWLGGRLVGREGRWDTGEPWVKGKWATSLIASGGEQALVLYPGKGWGTVDMDDVTSGLVIEWSDESASAPAPGDPVPTAGAAALPDGVELPTEVLELRKMAVELIEQKRNERDAQLADNVGKGLAWDLDVWLRGQNAKGLEQWTPHVEALREVLDERGRIPAPREFDDELKEIHLSAEMAGKLEFAYGKQSEIETDHLAELANIRDHYVRRLDKAAAEADARGDAAVARHLRQSINSIGDPQAWADSLSAE